MDINATLLGEMITFIVFIFVVVKFIWPYVIKAMQDRQKKIADGLEAAERGKRSLELARQHATQILSDSKKSANKILDRANTRVNQMIDQAKARGQQEGKRMIAHAERDIAHQVQKTKVQLRREMADVVVAGAEKVLQETIDKKAHAKMLNELIKELDP